MRESREGAREDVSPKTSAWRLSCPQTPRVPLSFLVSRFIYNPGWLFFFIIIIVMITPAEL